MMYTLTVFICLKLWSLILGYIESLFPIKVYFSDISKQVHEKTLERLKDIEWGHIPHSAQAHEMNISLEHNAPSFNADVIREYELHEFQEELNQHIHEYITEINGYMRSYSRSSWITQYKKGDYAMQHSHGSASISIAYYLASNGEDGDFYFSSPTPEKSTPTTEVIGNMYRVKPAERKLILFPGWLEHGVFKNTTDNIRQCLSANIYI